MSSGETQRGDRTRDRRSRKNTSEIDAPSDRGAASAPRYTEEQVLGDWFPAEAAADGGIAMTRSGATDRRPRSYIFDSARAVRNENMA